MSANGARRRSFRSGRFAEDVPRELGRYGDAQHGPTLVVTGGMHGNEPGGVLAMQRFVERLAKLEAEGRLPTFRGRVVLVVGNRRALSRGHRFVERDLNRRWFTEELEGVRRRARAAENTGERAGEDAEQFELLTLFDELEADARGSMTFLDLHSTSGETPPFSVLPDAPRNHAIAFSLGMPTIFGLEEAADGTMIGYYNDRGHAGVAVEGGQHEDPRAVDRLEAALWRTLSQLAIVEDRQVPRMGTFSKILEDSGRGRPRAVEIVYRHAIGPGDGFVMAPGFSSFQAVRKGEVLARDHHGDVTSPLDGRMLLPLYQGQGEDGFFLARDVSAARLKLAARLRQMGAQQALKMVPGVRMDAPDGDAVFVEPRRATGMTRELLRLLGYRKWRRVGDEVEFSRRRQIV